MRTRGQRCCLIPSKQTLSQQSQHRRRIDIPPSSKTMKVHGMSCLLLFVLSWFLALAAATTTGTEAVPVLFKVLNRIDDPDLNAEFDRHIGVVYAAQVMADATKLAWRTLGQDSQNERKNYGEVTLSVEGDLRHGVSTRGNSIDLGAGDGNGDGAVYDRDVSPFPKAKVTGVLYREITNVWQYDGNGRADRGLLKGIAELVQMKAGYATAHWAKKGEGAQWDELAPGVTAQFLQYCDTRHRGFVAQLGRKLKNGYTDRFFADITGKTVSQLWKEYKASYKNEI